MAVQKININEVKKLTEAVYRTFYNGSTELWFSLLSNDSVYIGNDGHFFFGGDAIRDYFKGFGGRTSEMFNEEYYVVPLSEKLAMSYGRFAIRSKKGDIYAVTHFSIIFRKVGDDYQIICQHNSYDYYQKDKQIGGHGAGFNVNTMDFVRELLMEEPFGNRIPIKIGHKTIYVNSYTILYAEGKRNKSNIVCIDRIIPCSSPIGELEKTLPSVFYRLHKSYLVNTRYITSLHRFELDLISDIKLPVPKQSYMKVKEDLNNYFTGIVCDD